MAKSKTGRVKIITQVKQARRAIQRCLQYIEAADMIAKGQNPLFEAAHPIAVQIAVTLDSCLDKMLKAL